MLRLSKLTDYGVVVLARLARDGTTLEGRVQTATGIAAATGIAEPTVAKVLKSLANAGLVEGVRGAHGGYRPRRGLAEVSLAEVIVALDGPIALTTCIDAGDTSCEAIGICAVRGRWGPVNEAIRDALDRIPLSALAGPARPPVALPAPINAAQTAA